jgi:hypothetical protein
MKKAKKPATSRAAKKATLAKKKTAPVKAAAKKKPVAKAAAKKADKKPSDKKLADKKVAPKKVEAKAKKPLAGPKKGAEKVVAAKAVVPPKVKEPKQAKVKPEKKPVEPKIEAEAPAQEENYEEAEVYLTDAEGRRYCRVKDCDQIAMVDAYCRYHYLLFWKKIQIRKEILTAGKLERYIEDLTARYPDKYLEMLRKDLRTEKDFTGAIAELEIDDAAVDSEYEDNEAQNYLDEVRGHTEGAGERDEESF